MMSQICFYHEAKFNVTIDVVLIFHHFGVFSVDILDIIFDFFIFAYPRIIAHLSRCHLVIAFVGD